PVSGIFLATPCFLFRRSTIAFFTIDWQSGTLYNVDLCDFPVIGNAASSGKKRSQANAFVCSNNSSKVVASNSPTTNFTRSAVLNHRLQRAIAETGASNITLPFSKFACYTNCFTSFATTDSKSIALVAIKFTSLTMWHSFLYQTL